MIHWTSPYMDSLPQPCLPVPVLPPPPHPTPSAYTWPYHDRVTSPALYKDPWLSTTLSLLVISGGQDWTFFQTWRPSLVQTPGCYYSTYSKQAGGTHLNGMLPCFSVVYSFLMTHRESSSCLHLPFFPQNFGKLAVIYKWYFVYLGVQFE